MRSNPTGGTGGNVGSAVTPIRTRRDERAQIHFHALQPRPQPNVLAWPLAFLGMQFYVSLFAEPVSISVWHFVASLVITLAIAWIAVATQAINAARLQPATVLRYE